MARNKNLRYLFAVILAAAFPLLAEAGKGNRGSQTTSPPSTSGVVAGSIVDQGGFPNAVAVDSLGRPCTAYFVGRELRFAVRDGASWSIQSLGLVGGDYGANTVDLAVDALDRPSIVYHVVYEGGVITGRIAVASFDGASWKFETVDYFGSSPSITLGPSGEKLVAYARSDSAGTFLKLAESSGSGWQLSAVDNSNVIGGLRKVYSPSIAVDGLGNVGISYGFYISAVTRQVRYAYRSAGVWARTQAVSDVGERTQLVFNAMERPIIAYWAGTGSLNMISSDGRGGWSNSLLPWRGTGRVGQMSLALDNLGVAFLTAYDTGSGDLHLITGTDGNFLSQILSSSGTVGMSNGISINEATNQKLVTFSDQTSGQLMFVAF